MCADDISPCGVPFCRSSGATLSSHFLHNDEANGVNNIDPQYLCAPRRSLSFPAVVSPSPTSGGQLFDESLNGAINPECTQQPPNHMIDHWFHRLGPSVQATSLETSLSNSATVSLPFQVFNEVSSHVSPKFIPLYWICFVFEMCDGGFEADS